MLADTHQELASFCDGTQFMGIVRVKPAEFSRPQLTKVWLCEGRTLHRLGMQGKSVSVLKPHNSVSPRFFPDLLENPTWQGSLQGDLKVWLVNLLLKSDAGHTHRERLRNGPDHRATQLSLFLILPRPWQGRATRS